MARAIKAARKAGLYVTGIRPDGTLILGEKPGADIPTTAPDADNAESSKWEDVEA
jgi:hypothetical protein